MTYKFEVKELPEPGRLRLTVFVLEEVGRNPKWYCSDIIEGPYVFIINKLTGYYDDTRRLRKVKP